MQHQPLFICSGSVLHGLILSPTPILVRSQKEPDAEVDERDIIARVLRKNTVVNPQLTVSAILEQMKSVDSAHGHQNS